MLLLSILLCLGLILARRKYDPLTEREECFLGELTELTSLVN